ncbi:MAG TPA: hypothetical protein VHP33_08585 [Polyangiaceae bacterium]|nr:hypothetical protein [Polyangiaceae bacterium]
MPPLSKANRSATRAATIATLALLLSSCGGRGTTNGTGTATGGTPGVGGTSGVSGMSGSGGTAPISCPTQSLSDWCATRDCPANEATLPIECGVPPFGVEYHRWTTRCGGSAIVRDGLTWVQTWFFDGNGALVGQAFRSDTGQGCALGDLAYTVSAGELCELAESGPELCHEACPTEPCEPHATIVSDFPVTLADAEGMTFKVCRDTSCMGAQMPYAWSAGQTLDLEGGAGLQSATVTFSNVIDGLRLQLDWSMPNVDPAPTERYHAWLEDQTDLSHPSVEVFDTSITYDVMDLGCAGTCLVTKVDLQAR